MEPAPPEQATELSPSPYTTTTTSSFKSFQREMEACKHPSYLRRRHSRGALVCTTVPMQRGFPNCGMQTISGRYTEAHASGGYTISLYLDKQSQTKNSLRKACILNGDLKGYKNNLFDLGVMFILFAVLTTNRQLKKKCHLL